MFHFLYSELSIHEQTDLLRHLEIWHQAAVSQNLFDVVIYQKQPTCHLALAESSHKE